MKVIVRNVAVEYSIAGEGPLVLFLHGWGSSSVAFEGLKQTLLNDFTVVTLDFPGFGGSEQPKEDWYIQDYAEFTKEFLDKIAVDEKLYAVFGHSFGGRVIIKAISRQLLSPEKIVLMGAAGVKPKKSGKQHLYKVVAKVGKAVTFAPGLRRFASPLRQRLYGSIGSTDYLNSGSMQKIFLNTINEDLRQDALDNTLSTLLIWGENDFETPVDQAKELHARMPNSELIILQDAGHYVFIDKPDETIKKIKEFLHA